MTLSQKEMKLFVFLMLGIPLVFVALVIALIVAGFDSATLGLFISIADTALTLFLTAFLAIMAVFTAAMSEKMAGANQLLADITREQHERSLAEFRAEILVEDRFLFLRDVPGITKEGDFPFRVSNAGWKDGAVSEARVEAIFPGGRTDVRKVVFRSHGEEPTETDRMIRAGDQKSFLGRVVKPFSTAELQAAARVLLVVVPVLGKAGTHVCMGHGTTHREH